VTVDVEISLAEIYAKVKFRDDMREGPFTVVEDQANYELPT
jgi:hypothetical protein